ncbi:MAG TPA: zinc-binding dehydrogenase [Burkholderiaceae bacterium]|nr:zinc-binding dehydrogenase [Burkholderiaceae bacterium]
MTTVPRTALQIRSLVKTNGELELSLAEFEVPQPAGGEVLVRVEAAPINPSDHVLLFAGADLNTLRAAGDVSRPVITAQVPPGALRSSAARVGQSLPTGIEGCGVVVAAGSSPAAQALLGKTVALYGGAMYSQYRAAPVEMCLLLPDGTAPAEGASSFVNPLTALGMVETMRSEGHRALVHTAAASNLGQMLNRICLEDGIELVNVVRKPAQAALLRSQGAKFVVDTSAGDFEEVLLAAIDATGATIAFDAVGGGKLAGQILTAMETSLVRKMSTFNRYGSPTHKQVYSYGLLDTGPIELARGTFGMAWGLGGWLLTYFLQKASAETVQRLKQRVASNLKTTFASAYTKEVSLAQALRADEISVYSKRATGAKYLVCPNKDL